jgi:hypothetical protein
MVKTDIDYLSSWTNHRQDDGITTTGLNESDYIIGGKDGSCFLSCAGKEEMTNQNCGSVGGQGGEREVSQ